MAQHDYVIDNDSGINVRNDINNALLAIVTNNSGTSPPASPVAGTLWFDISVTGGPGVLKLYDGTAWLTIAAGVAFVPLTGGNILGDLTVTGTFSNPGYSQKLTSGMGTTAPANPQKGMLWYDSSTNPPVLKIYGVNSTWQVLVDYTSPSFTQMVTVNGATYAVLNLTSAAEARRVYSDSVNDRLVFDTQVAPAAGTMIVTDAGDVWIASLGYIGTTVNGKQANLGFTPVRQADANVIWVGGSPPSLWIGESGVHQGYIRLGQQVTVVSHGAVGAYARMTSVDPTIGGNGTVAGGNLRFGSDVSNLYGTGTWRNMGSTITDKQSSIFQRQA